jgi:hypothetical protein
VVPKHTHESSQKIIQARRLLQTSSLYRVAQSPSKDNDFIKIPVMQKNQIISTTTILQNGFETPNLLDFAYGVIP